MARILVGDAFGYLEDEMDCAEKYPAEDRQAILSGLTKSVERVFWLCFRQDNGGAIGEIDYLPFKQSRFNDYTAKLWTRAVDELSKTDPAKAVALAVSAHEAIRGDILEEQKEEPTASPAYAIGQDTIREIIEKNLSSINKTSSEYFEVICVAARADFATQEAVPQALERVERYLEDRLVVNPVSSYEEMLSWMSDVSPDERLCAEFAIKNLPTLLKEPQDSMVRLLLDKGEEPMNVAETEFWKKYLDVFSKKQPDEAVRLFDGYVDGLDEGDRPDHSLWREIRAAHENAQEVRQNKAHHNLQKAISSFVSDYKIP